MKVCLIGDNPSSFWTGSSTLKVQNSIHKFLNKKGIKAELYIYTNKKNITSKLFEKLIFENRESGKIISGGIVKLAFYLIHEKIDITHFVLSRFFSVPLLIFLFITRIKLISSFHDNIVFPEIPKRNYYNIKYFLLKKLSYYISDIILIHNKRDYDRFKKNYNISKFRFVKNGIDFNEINISKTNKKNIDILFSGGIEKHKGLNFFLDTLKRVKSKYNVVFCGPGNEKKEKFLGSLNSKDYRNILIKSKILVVPSEYESFGIAGLEALAFGVPIIITRNSGLAQYLDDGYGCFLINYGDEKEFAEKITLLLSDENKYRQLSQQAILVSKKFSWDIVIYDYIKVYSQTL